MRLDKYLKVSRLIKRRTTAKEVADNDRILVNNHSSKPSTEIKIGDIIEIRMGLKVVTIKVLSTSDFVRKDDSSLMYELVSQKKIENTTINE